MNRLVSLSLVALSIFLLSKPACAEINTDISNSTVEILNSTTMRIRNLTAEGYSGKYWVDFQWDSSTLVYRPIQVGAEAGTTSKKRAPLFYMGCLQRTDNRVLADGS